MAATVPTPQQQIRRRNLSRVLHALSDGGPASRAAIAARIGLTRAAVSTLAEELLRAGLLVELGPGRPDGVGRPGTALALDEAGACGLGAEIGVDGLAVRAVDLRGRTRAHTTLPGAHRASAPDAVLTRLARLLEETTGRLAAQGLRPAGVAVAVPGMVARGSTVVVRAPNLGWPVTDLAEHLGRLRAPLAVDNEANYGALAELRLGGRPPGDDFVHVSAQTGIGAAVVLDGALLRGARGFAGELGHVPVHPEGPPCACGGRGCLEQYAGEEALLRAAGSAPGSGTGRLAARAAAGDTAARAALAAAGAALGIALAGAVNLLDPRTVVLGGALAGLGPWLLPPLERELAARTAAPGGPPEVVVSAAGPGGPLLGAAHSVVRAVLDDPLAPAHLRAAAPAGRVRP
jgi:predicted NBD/HSP70 family sugar kinase